MKTNILIRQIIVRISVLCLFVLFGSNNITAQENIVDPIAKFKSLPMGVGKTISFTTSEGSNMDVDISPNGKLILFTLLGDIYKLPITGGSATQITRGMAMNCSPVWSPDGKKIAYISDESGGYGLHIMDTTGKSKRLLTKAKLPLYARFNAPKWTPDGLAVSVDQMVYPLIGGEERLPDSNMPVDSFIGFSSDGLFMYYSDFDLNGNTIIIKYNRINSAKTIIYTARHKQDFSNVRVSPDGRWLTYIAEKLQRPTDSLMIYDISNKKERLLASLGIFSPGGLRHQHYSFSSDSKKLLIGYGGKIREISIESGEQKVIPFSANVNFDLVGEKIYNTHRLLHDSLKVNYIRDARRSPDGSTLIFSALEHIYTMSYPHGIPRTLVNQDQAQFHPTFSEDGKWVAYVTWSDNKGGQVWIVSSKGGNPVQITKISGQYSSPCFSPDGKYLIFVKGEPHLGGRETPGENGKLIRLSLKDKHCEQLADSISLYNNPVFSFDGKSVIYKPRQIDNSSVESKLVVKDLLTHKTSDFAVGIYDNESIKPLKSIPSPDEHYIVYLKNESLYLVPNLKLGSPQVIINSEMNLPIIRFAKSGFDPAWEDHGKKLSWSYGNKYFNIDPQKIIDAATSLLNANPSAKPDGQQFLDVDIPADQEIEVNLKVPKFFAKGTVALKNVRIISMKADEIIDNGTLIIEDGIIKSVGAANSIKIPNGAKVFDLSGKTVMPGLVDLHSHMPLPVEIYPQQYWGMLADLSYGVTTARDVSSSHDMFGYQELIEAGQMLGPRFYSVGWAIRPNTYPRLSKNEAEVVIENRKKMGATVIKQYVLSSRIQKQWLLNAARKQSLNVTNEGASDLLEQLAMIKDGSTGIEHNPDWGDIYDDVISLYAKSGVFLDPVFQYDSGKAYIDDSPRYYFELKYLRDTDSKFLRFTDKLKWAAVFKENLANKNRVDTINPTFIAESRYNTLMSKKGAKIVMGSHGEDLGVGAHFELWALQMGGMSNLEAIRAATLTGAEGLGVQNDIGSLEVGKIADLIILDKNPLDDIHNTRAIKYVMKDGILYDGNTLDITWPFKKKFCIKKFEANK